MLELNKQREAGYPFVWLPCLRCGEQSVPIPSHFLRIDGNGSTWTCRARPCEAEHFLSVNRQGEKFMIAYQRYTLRYPLEFYDEGITPQNVRLHVREPEGQLIEGGYAGPVVVYPRKKRFSLTEIKSIWEASGGRCHICKRRWQIAQRGVRGWHIDHVIPHIGGGRETEHVANLRVACAICNLKKGKGVTNASILLGLRDLVRSLRP